MRPALLPASTLLTGLPQIADNETGYPLYVWQLEMVQARISELGPENVIFGRVNRRPNLIDRC
jgi:hypothetical protein